MKGQKPCGWLVSSAHITGEAAEARTVWLGDEAKGWREGRGTRGRNEGKAKVRSPPRLEEAGVSAHAIGAAPLTEALLVFSFPTHAMSRTAVMKLAVHTVEMEARWQRK